MDKQLLARLRSGSMSLAALALIMGPLSIAPAKADPISVFVGYADNLRASGFFPTRWIGDPNVVTQSPSGQTLDTGAIRLDNTGATPITITNFQVHFPSNNSIYTLWNTLVIAAGSTGIFTQDQRQRYPVRHQRFRCLRRFAAD